MTFRYNNKQKLNNPINGIPDPGPFLELNKLFVQKVGIGTNFPAYPLDVNGSAKFTTIIDGINSTGTAGQVLSSSGTGLSWNSLGYPGSIYQGKNFIPSQSTGTISLFGTTAVSNRYFGGILTPGGLIYATPGLEDNVLIINTYNNSTDITTISGLNGTNYPVIGSSTTDKWSGAVIYNYDIYCIPLAADAIMKINAIDNTFSFIDVSVLSSVTYKWYGAVLSSNNFIYGIPHEETRVLKIDPLTNNISTILITGLSAGTYKYGCGALAPNGNIYCPPFEETGVLVINPLTNTASANIAGLIGLPGGGDWLGAVLGPNGKIYGVPFNNSDVLVINPVTNTYTTIVTGVVGTNKWNGGVLGMDGKIYCIPHRATSILVIDPTTDTVSFINGVNNINDRWVGGILSPLGPIYMIPGVSSSIGTLKTNLPSLPPWMLVSNFNKY